MIVRRVHPGCFDGIGNLGRQIIEAVDLPFKGSQTFQFSVLAGRYEITADPPMTGDGDGFTLRLFLVASKTFGEFCSSGRNHGNCPNIRKR